MHLLRHPSSSLQSGSAVLGIGNPVADLDALGPRVIEALHRTNAIAVDPVHLVDVLGELQFAILVDSARGRPSGKIEVWTVDEVLALSMPEPRLDHALSLPAALRLAKLTDCLPKVCHIVTIGVGDASAMPESRLRQAVAAAAAKCLELLKEATNGHAA